MVSHTHADEYKTKFAVQDSYSLDSIDFTKLDIGGLSKCTEQCIGLEDSVNKAAKILMGFQKSPFTKGFKYQQWARDIDDQKILALEKKANDLIYEKGKFLDHNAQMDMVRELANIVAPVLYAGVEGAPGEQNFRNLQNYLAEEKSAARPKEGERRNALTDVIEAIAKGQVMKAKQIIVDAYTNANVKMDTERFTAKLIPPDNEDYWHKLAVPLAEMHNEVLKRAGITDKAVTPEKIAGSYQSILGALQQFAATILGYESLATKKPEQSRIIKP